MGVDTVYKIADFPVYGAASSIPGAGMTAEGGLFIWMKNGTGAASVKGQLVAADTAAEDSFDTVGVSGEDCVGAVYDAGVADGEWCRVVVAGRAQVLLKDTTAGTRGNWVNVSDAAGRALATTASPPGHVASHWEEIGHCLETVGSGTDVLCWILLHFN